MVVITYLQALVPDIGALRSASVNAANSGRSELEPASARPMLQRETRKAWNREGQGDRLNDVPLIASYEIV